MHKIATEPASGSFSNALTPQGGLLQAWSSLSLRWRLISTTAVLVLVLCTGITVILMHIGSSVLDDITGSIGTLSNGIQLQQKNSLDSVERAEIGSATRSLMT